MMTLARFSLAAVSACIVARTAEAVGLVNEDEQDHVIMIDENGDGTGVTLCAGNQEAGVGESCSLSL